MKNKNIILMGFMGSGKTTVGKILSKDFMYKFFDTDTEIEKKTGMTVSDIFDKYGESRFRELEIEVVEEISEEENAVISTGGGIVLNECNMKNLCKKGYIVYLEASSEKIYDNLKDDTTRPLLANLNSQQEKLKKIQELLSKREPLYCRYSQLTVETTGKALEQSIEYIKTHIFKEDK